MLMSLLSFFLIAAEDHDRPSNDKRKYFFMKLIKKKMYGDL